MGSPALLLALACGAAPTDGPVEEAAGTSGQVGAGGSGDAAIAFGGAPNGGGSPTLGCGGPCPGGTFCSPSGQCIADGTCSVDADCAAGLACDTTLGKCTPGGGCGAKPFQITALKPNVLIALDRSGSMGKSVPGAGKSRWQVAQAALDKLFASYKDTIGFGLVMFSACNGPGCAPGKISNPIGSYTTDIQKSILASQLCNSGKAETVIGGTLNGLIGEVSLQVADRPNVIVLMTDGADNCGGGGAKAAAQLLAQAVPVKTYVVGFSGDVNAGELTAIAKAAGTAPYFQADTGTQLDTALSQIANNVATCTFKLDQVPPSGSLWVFFDKDPTGIAKDPNNGFDYDAASNTLTFNGASCAQIQQGKVTAIDVIYACSKPTPS
ncbi:MAG: VWA domain-containing protein [Myxococcales bacterium]|nr:VWA domain-containing protein [Myxococcales bacterium]